MKPSTHPLVLAASLLLLGAACQRQAPPVEDWLARVGTVQIRPADLQDELDRRRQRGSDASATAVLEDLIAREALLADARSKGLERDPELQRAWQNLLIAKLKERELTPRLEAVVVSAEDVGEAYRQSHAVHTRPAELRFAILKLGIDRFASEEKRGRLRQRLEEARKQALTLGPEVRDFGPLAVNYSEDQVTRYKGGDTGWTPAEPGKSRWDPLIVKTASALASPGAVSEVLEAHDGLYLVRLIERRDAEVASLAQVEPSVRRQVATGKRRQIEQEFVSAARRGAGVQVAQDRLNEFSSKQAPGNTPKPIPDLADGDPRNP